MGCPVISAAFSPDNAGKEGLELLREALRAEIEVAVEPVLMPTSSQVAAGLGKTHGQVAESEAL